VQNAKDVKVSVPFHSATVEICMELVGHFAVVCQFVPYAVFHLYCYCKKHKRFSLSHVREGRRSLVSSVKVVMVVTVIVIISAKYNGKMLSGLEPSFIYGASLSFFPLECL